MLNYLFVLSYLIVSVKSASLEICTTPINEAGKCVPVKFCSIFHEYLEDTKIKLTEEFYMYLNKSLCGFIKSESYVCCAARHITITARSDHKNLNLLEVNDCGNLNDDRISYGNKTELNQYPWMALLQYETPSGLEFKCGGSLITRRYVLTAAHCVKISSKLVSVRLGEHDLDTEKDCDEISGYCAPPVQDIGVEEIITHFKYQRGKFKNDIALIRLAYEADIKQENVKLICLPVSSNFSTINRDTAIISGWGYTEERNSLSNELLQATVSLESISVCQHFYKSKIIFSSSELCAGGKNKVDTCFGDSGGPLFTTLVDPKIDQKLPLYYQIGIVSAGYTICGEMDTYTIFTSVTFYIDWILDNLKP